MRKASLHNNYNYSEHVYYYTIKHNNYRHSEYFNINKLDKLNKHHDIFDVVDHDFNNNFRNNLHQHDNNDNRYSDDSYPHKQYIEHNHQLKHDYEHKHKYNHYFHIEDNYKHNCQHNVQYDKYLNPLHNHLEYNVIKHSNRHQHHDQ